MTKDMTTPEGDLDDLAGKTVVLLLSGGLDSATCLALATRAGAHVLALTIDYNQRHRIELESAARLAQHYAVGRHVVLPLDLRAFGGSALTADIAVPAGGEDNGIPITYVPARNTIFLSVALGWAEAEGASDLLIGVNALDYSGYPDCRPEFVAAFETMANVATRAGIEGTTRYRVRTPLLAMSKAQIAAAAVGAGVPVPLTWSCYDPTPDGRHCGRCDSCHLRRKGFADAKIADPTRYA